MKAIGYEVDLELTGLEEKTRRRESIVIKTNEGARTLRKAFQNKVHRHRSVAKPLATAGPIL